MKIIFTVIISAAVFFVMLQIFPTENELDIYENTVRLHVLANSDSEGDQALKLLVRDAILNTVNDLGATGKEDAVEKIENQKDKLIKVAETVIKNNGYDYGVTIEIGREMYPTKHYEDFSLPAGEYTSVRVVIGEGKGQNWWCVLYPPMCSSTAVKYDEEACIEAGLTKEQYDLITANDSGKYKIKFRFLELAAEVFGFEY